MYIGIERVLPYYEEFHVFPHVIRARNLLDVEYIQVDGF